MVRPLEESRGVAQTKYLQTVDGEYIFSGKLHVNYSYISHQPMKHSYDKIICFQYFHDGHTDTCQRKSLSEAEEYFQLDA